MNGQFHAPLALSPIEGPLDTRERGTNSRSGHDGAESPVARDNETTIIKPAAYRFTDSSVNDIRNKFKNKYKWNVKKTNCLRVYNFVCNADVPDLHSDYLFLTYKQTPVLRGLCLELLWHTYYSLAPPQRYFQWSQSTIHDSSSKNDLITYLYI
jgi:hypothetical protein